MDHHTYRWFSHNGIPLLSIYYNKLQVCQDNHVSSEQSSDYCYTMLQHSNIKNIKYLAILKVLHEESRCSQNSLKYAKSNSARHTTAPRNP